MNIVYPASIGTPYKRLSAIYSLAEQARLAHNLKGALHPSPTQWKAYQERFSPFYFALLREQNKLKQLIKVATPDFKQWDKLSDGDQCLLMQLAYGDKESLKVQPTQATSVLLDQIKALTPDDEVPIADPYEDWTTAAYTEVDAEGILTVATNQLSVTSLDREDIVYCYKDAGVGHFDPDAVNHYVDAKLDSVDTINVQAFAFWCLANTTTPIQTTDPVVMAWLQASAISKTVTYLMLDDGATDNSDYYTSALNLGTRIYYNPKGDGVGNLNLLIYSDAAHQSLLDTPTVPTGATTYRYMHSIATRGGGTAAYNADGDIYNLDLQEAAPPAGGVRGWCQK